MFSKSARLCLICMLATVASIFGMSCNSIPKKGVSKNINTGMVTHWTETEPEQVVLVMNKEELGHTDIPLGENFQVLAKNVKGLVAKDGKISVGCALTIADTTGKLLMNEADLFAGQGELKAEKDQFLRCIVYTGSPMAWEEHYDVKVRFWDKNGKGEIESTVRIRMIDIP